MRHLIDTYIQADDPRRVSEFESMGLLEIITKLGIEEAKNSLPKSLRESQEAVAEAIENNVRAKIIKEHLNDPTFFENMSVLLDEIVSSPIFHTKPNLVFQPF